MRTTTSLFANDLLKLQRGTREPLETGEYQFTVSAGDPYLYVTAEQLYQIAEHFHQLADDLHEETHTDWAESNERRLAAREQDDQP